MKKATLVLVAFGTAWLLGSAPALAYYDGPWCAVFTIGPGVAAERCDYRDFESCRMDTIAGNRGFCRQNGYWQGSPQAYSPRQRKHKHKHAQR